MNSVAKIGERIKTLREEKGFTQQTLADALHLKRETINMWENGFRDLKTGSIIALADFFDVSADYILGRTDNRTLDTSIQSACEVTGLTEHAIAILNKAQRNKGKKGISSKCTSEDGKEISHNYHYAFLFLFDRLIRYYSTPDLVRNFAIWVAAFSEPDVNDSKDENESNLIAALSADQYETDAFQKRIAEITGDPLTSYRFITKYDLSKLYEYKCGSNLERMIEWIVIASSNLYPDHLAHQNDHLLFSDIGDIV